MDTLPYHDFRGFIEEAKKVSQWRLIEGADWNNEIGALIEATAELDERPMLLFDKIKNYPAGFRLVSLAFANYKRTALAFGIAPEKTKLEVVRLLARKMKSGNSIPAAEVKSSPLMENVMQGDQIDLLRFPSPRFHDGDGGRYIGTGDCLINADPDTGFINAGTYRIQLHEKNLLGLWMSPGQDGRLICAKYWQQGKSCPVVATFGSDPLLFTLAHTKLAYGKSELDYAGGLMGRPLEFIRGPVTGLPIPAGAEIAIEGEIPPPSEEARAEGPFGEWPGYYSGGTIGTGEAQPVIRVKAIYHRNDPIILGCPPQRPPEEQARYRAVMRSALLKQELKKTGLPDVVATWCHEAGGSRQLTAVSIKQRYPGHASQAGHLAAMCRSVAYAGKYVIVVDDDIDVSNLEQLMWAVCSRSDPATSIDFIRNAWSTPLDPSIPPEKK
ncbi:MAG: UbiD family decarboxylase, partial [Candidatus Binatia bacterium]